MVLLEGDVTFVCYYDGVVPYRCCSVPYYHLLHCIAIRVVANVRIHVHFDVLYDYDPCLHSLWKGTLLMVTDVVRCLHITFRAVAIWAPVATRVPDLLFCRYTRCTGYRITLPYRHCT